MSDTSQIEAIAHRWHTEVACQGQLDLADQILDPDVVVHIAGSPDVHGVVGAKQFVEGLLSAFPDFAVQHEDTVAGGDRVAVRWRWQGTNLGELNGMPATGKHAEGPGTDFYHFRNGKIIEMWIMPDNFATFQQLGLISLPAPTG